MNHPSVVQALAAERVRDAITRAAAKRLAGSIRHVHPVRESNDILIREARPAEAGALARVARLDDPPMGAVRGSTSS